MKKRDRLSSRIGFILLSAGCAIGLGNVWRFPYITGLYGGALFVLIYLVFLVILGIPVMSMEFAVGRGSQRSIATGFRELEPKGTKWHIYSWFGMAGNYLLMMFYTTVTGWMLFYLAYMARGAFTGLTPEGVGQFFDGHTGNTALCITGMLIACVLGFGICALGVQNGVEKITKIMMSALFVVLIVLVVRSVTLPGGGAGLKFYLMPSLGGIRQHGVLKTVFAAMGQAFFSLSIGMGSMQIFGSYIGKEHRLLGESINITILDTAVAILSGLVIFPACFAFGISPDAGPGLIFVTLPNVFNEMPLGRLWGTLFFVFMSFAALSTVVAVFENIIAFAIDKTGCSRKKSIAINFVAVTLLSLPCALGFSAWSGFQIPVIGNILGLEDFVVSNNILPLGSMIFVLFCMTKKGWGWKNFLAEVDAGSGLKFPARLRPYFTYVLPLIVVLVFIFGYIDMFLWK